MSPRNIVTVVEIDVDQCSLTWGVLPCRAAFGTGVVRKCYNTFQTCDDPERYTKASVTLRFCEPTYKINGNYMPTLVSVGGYEQEVNIAGYKPDIGGLGQRAAVTVKFRDMPSRDTLLDKYWAGRIDGSAQTDEGGYDPLSRGSFWTKFKARNPNYAGRSLRVSHGYVSASGDFVATRTRAYVMAEFEGPDTSGDVTIKAKDILYLADNKKALAPSETQARLLADIDATQTSAVLSPAGVSFPSSGFATIGSEIVSFTKSGNNLTLGRGRKGTVAATHSANDTIQPAFNVERVRADTVIRNLLVNYAGIPSSYINFSEWQSEFDRWGGKMVLSATITKPTSVSVLIGEISQLGLTVWWDEVAQKIRVKLNHPPDTTPAQWSDNYNIIKIKQEDNDDERATRIFMWTVQIDPTKELNKDNFIRGYLNVSADSELPQMFGQTRTHEIYNRWLNHGDYATINIVAGRLLNRYKRAPVTYTATIDFKDDPSLTDVISLNSHIVTDITGKPVEVLTQVFYRADDKLGSTVTAKLQRFQFDARYGQIAPNNYPRYTSATPAQKIHGSFFVGPSLKFGDGGDPYQFV